jgi:hypothetical protein
VTAGKGIFHNGVRASLKDTKSGVVSHLYQIMYMQYAATLLLSRKTVSQNILQNNWQISKLSLHFALCFVYRRFGFGLGIFGIREQSE